MDLNHHDCASGDGNMLAHDGESRPSRELDHNSGGFCAGSDHHQQYAGFQSSSVHDRLSSHHHTWRDGPHYVGPNYTQAPFDFAEYPSQAPQPCAQYDDHVNSYPEQVYHHQANYDHYSYETQQVQQSYAPRYLPEYPDHTLHSSPETVASQIDFTNPSPSQISTYSSLSNALDAPIIVRRGFTNPAQATVLPKEEHFPTHPVAHSVPPMGMLPLETDITPPTPAASTPSSTFIRTPTLSPSVVTAPQTFEVIQDDSAFPSYEKARKRQQAPPGPPVNDTTSPFTTEPLVASTTSVAAAPAPAPVQKTAKSTRGVKGKRAPRKKLTLACLFCRERKIACTLPSEGDVERRCNQCVKRSRACQMPPGGSRRGQYARQKAHKDIISITDATAAVNELTLAPPV
ncbi:unnamed protein product [Peniophora sp. CBMAI 1063]|nr:unnamed protein product [Peniophora sp. CBMAI 1063]